ncbi:MAG TPA: helix-turn-helix domain-containing protein [Ktedonobacterales bacterium]|nr:helix-turn-helix domain-containing protein [Ktedonobacterales bacterium]
MISPSACGGSLPTALSSTFRADYSPPQACQDPGRHPMPIPSSAVLEAPASGAMLVEAASLPRGFVQLPKAVLYARHLSRDAKLLYAVLLGYAWQDQRCFPGYQRLCADLTASENAVRTWMRELEAAHLISQRRRGQGRTNLYLFHDLRTATLEVQEQHKMAVVEPQEAQDNEEAVHKEKEHKASGVRTSKGTLTSNEELRNEHRFTHSSVFSTAKDKVLRALAGQQTEGFMSLQRGASPPQGHESSDRAQGQWGKGATQAHQLADRHIKSPEWLPSYIVDFSREFHDEAATASNITRAAHLFEWSQMDADAFIEQVYAARRITQGRANIQKRAEVGKNPAWPAGFPNRMPYFFSVLEDRLGLKAAT